MCNTCFEIRNECPACSSKEFRIIYQCPFDVVPIRDYLVDFYSKEKVEFEYLEGASYILCECDNCSLIFQREIPNENLMEKLYEQWIDPIEAFNHSKKQYDLGYYTYYAQDIMQIISYFRKVPSSLRFFDFGMGWANWALMAEAFGCESYGAELSEKRIEHAKSVGIKVIQWCDIPNYQFDIINTDQVFEHISEPLQTLRHLKKALKPNGIIKICVPTATNIHQRLKIMDWKSPKGSNNSLNPVAPLEHINCFKRSSILEMANKADMKEVFIPMKTQYKYLTDWGNIKRSGKNIFRPLYRNILKKPNHIFLCNI